MSMVLTVFVLNLYGITDHPVPRWMRALVLIYLARFLGMFDTADLYERARSRHSFQGGKRLRRAKSSSTLKTSFLKDTATQVYGIADLMYRIGGRHQRNDATTDAAPADDRTPSNPDRLNGSLLLGGGEDDSRDPTRPDYSRDWRRVAEVFDRFFFWTFLLAIVVTTTVLFLPLMRSFIAELP